MYVPALLNDTSSLRYDTIHIFYGTYLADAIVETELDTTLQR